MREALLSARFISPHKAGSRGPNLGRHCRVRASQALPYRPLNRRFRLDCRRFGHDTSHTERRLEARVDERQIFRKTREQLGLSQQALAQKAGICRSTVRNFELGKGRISIRSILAISNALATEHLSQYGSLADFPPDELVSDHPQNRASERQLSELH
ncbi:helix-turn-helix transcriptional regulator [Altererythrobacter sp.]|uniref:helix-turn-helix transcriptional regulator n=1 Tax=Altererythrobacter sp. TaxID=1872480 RepID=UPI003CFF9A82